MRSASIVGIGQLPVAKSSPLNLREMGAQVALQAMAAAGLDHVDALYASNMLSDELQGQKHIAALIADQAGLEGIETIQLRAAMASGAAALRAGFLAIASGAIDSAVIVGVEIMSGGGATAAMAKALDAIHEVPGGATMLSQNAAVMQHYLDRYHPPADALAHFSTNAHANARHNVNAIFRDRQFAPRDVLASRLVSTPIRLLDCSPICDGAAALVLAADRIAASRPRSVRVLASTAASDRFRLADRADPLALAGVQKGARQAFRQAGIGPEEVDLFEAHDAFSIMACLSIEAAGFAEHGCGWRMAMAGDIGLDGRIPLSTMGGLKARGHPIGASALYQACELYLQLNGEAGRAQVEDAQVGLMQSVGGVATTVITHVLGR